MAPIIPKEEEEQAQLEQDLSDMGCSGLLDRPRALTNEEMVREFVSIREQLVERRNIFDNTIRDRPQDWTAGVWRAVY